LRGSHTWKFWLLHQDVVVVNVSSIDISARHPQIDDNSGPRSGQCRRLRTSPSRHAAHLAYDSVHERLPSSLMSGRDGAETVQIEDRGAVLVVRGASDSKLSVSSFIPTFQTSSMHSNLCSAVVQLVYLVKR
jgi:hypothetical protein